MKQTLSFFIILIFLLSACGTQSTPAPSAPPTSVPTDIPDPTATQATIEAFPTAEIPGLFGMLNSADVQAGLMMEPVVAQIFELKLVEWVEAGQIEEFQVERLGVYPKGDDTLYAEVFFRVKTDGIFWPEDGGIEEDGWVTGKCVRFDIVITEDAYQLLNKRLCS